MSPRRIAVIGAGVVGVSSAYRLQNEVSNVKVTLFSDKFVPHITSAVAAGFWIDRTLSYGEASVDLPRRWSYETWDYLLNIENSEDAIEAGVFQISGYHLFKGHAQRPYYADKLIGFRDMTAEELEAFDRNYETGFSYSTIVAQTTKYIPWLMQKFQTTGGQVKLRRIEHFDELFSEFDLVVNCTGLDACRLTGVQDVEPIRGQLVKLYAPHLKVFLISEDEDLYVIPNNDAVYCGGTHQRGNWSREVDPTDAERIRTGCISLIPSLKKAPIVDHVVGLRPYRTSVRLETERTSGGNVVIHNYGHGGCGVTLHWGCAGDVVKLAKLELKKCDGPKAKL